METRIIGLILIQQGKGADVGEVQRKRVFTCNPDIVVHHDPNRADRTKPGPVHVVSVGDQQSQRWDYYWEHPAVY